MEHMVIVLYINDESTRCNNGIVSASEDLNALEDVHIEANK